MTPRAKKMDWAVGASVVSKVDIEKDYILAIGISQFLIKVTCFYVTSTKGCCFHGHVKGEMKRNSVKIVLPEDGMGPR